MPAHGWVGAMATYSSTVYFALQNMASDFATSNKKKAGEKGGGWGDGIFARPPISSNLGFVEKKFELHPINTTN